MTTYNLINYGPMWRNMDKMAFMVNFHYIMHCSIEFVVMLDHKKFGLPSELLHINVKLHWPINKKISSNKIKLKLGMLRSLSRAKVITSLDFGQSRERSATKDKTSYKEIKNKKPIPNKQN